jgi:hypothetical protein
VTQGTLSSSNIYVFGGITLATNAPIAMNSTFSNQGTTNLAETAVSRLNAVTWPTIAGTPGQSLTISSDPGIAFWAPFPIFATLSGWWLVAPNGPVYMNNQQFTSLSGINGIRLNFNSTSNNIGIGANVLTGTTGNGIIAIGLSAAVGSSGSNLIYLGSNPGGAQAYNNRFTVFSTTSGLPFLQGDVSNMQLGIGKSPSTALDVSGSVAISQTLNVTGVATLPNAVATTLSSTTLYATTAINTSGTATLNAVNIPTTLGVTGITTLSATNTQALTATSLASTGTITSAGQSTLNSIIVPTTLNVIGNTTLTSMNATSITGITIGSTGTAALNAVTVGGTLGVTGQTTLGNATATSLGATTLTATGALNAGSATATLGSTTVNTGLNVTAPATLTSAVLSQNLTVCGQTLFRNLSFTSLNSLTWNSPATGNTVLSVDSTGRILSWVSLTTIGLQNWAQSLANSTISLQGLYGITGITSFNNISAVFVSASAQVGLGPGVLSNNFASNIVAFGPGAGAVGLNTTGVGPNNIFLGSNPGGSSNVSNSLVVYSQTAGSPLIYGDLSKNQVTIAGQTNTAGYTLNVNGSALAQTLNSPSTSSNSIGGVTMSNSILTVGRINSLTNLNGVETKFDSANQVIFIGQKFGNADLPAGTVNVFLGQFAGASYTGAGTVGIGPGAGAFLTGSNNTCIGPNAGNSSTGSCNNFIGTLAGQVNNASFTNAIGASAALGNQASFVDAMGWEAAAGNVNTGTNLIAIGSNAGRGNHGASNIYIGARAGNGQGAAFNSNSCNAIVIGSLTGIATNGNANIGNRSINIGTRSSSSQGSEDQIAIGTGAYGGSIGSIAIGVSAFAVGPKTIVIGSNVGGGANPAGVIAIGTNAGTNLPDLANNIYIGSNAGYTPATSNTLVVQSLVSTAPTLQADLANRRLGVGGAPSYSLDVQTNSAGLNGVRIARNDTSNVTAGLYLEAGFIPTGGGLTVLNTTFVSFATRGGGGGTVVQSLMSSYEGGNYGLSIKNGNTISSETFVRVDAAGRRMGVGTVSPTTSLDVSGTFNVTGTTTLSALNGVRWPTTAGAVNTQLVISATGQASWVPPGTIDSASWSINPALQTVNMAGFGLTGLSSINGLMTTINSTLNQIGIGANLLTNNTANFVVAFGNGAGSNAAANSTWSNCVYLGAQPAGGTAAGGANTFLLYSTTAGVPALQVNMGSNWLGVGKAPTMPLDILGNGQVTGQFTARSKLLVGNFTANTCNYAVNILSSGGRTGFITWSCNTAQTPYLGLGWDQAVDGLVISSGPGLGDIGTVNSFFVSRNTGFVGIGKNSASFPLDVAGQINTSDRFSSPSTSSNSIGGVTMSNSILTVGTVCNVTNLNGQQLRINGTAGVGLIGIGPNMGLGGTSNIAIGNYAGWGYTQTGTNEGGQLIAIGGSAGYASSGVSNTLLGWHAGEFNSGSFVNAIGWRAGEFNTGSYVNAMGSEAAWSNTASNVDAIGTYAGYQNVSTGINLVAIGSNAGRGNRGASNIYIGAGAGYGTSVTNVANAIVIGSGAGAFPASAGSGYVVGTQSIIVGMRARAAGTDSISIGTLTGVSNTGTNSIAIGSSAKTSGPDCVALGTSVTAGLGGSKVIAIGSNAGESNLTVTNAIYLGNNPGYSPASNNNFVLYSTNTTLPTLQADLSNRWLGVGRTPSAALDVAGTIRASGPVISTLNISGISSGSSLILTTDVAATYFSLMTVASNITVTLPTTLPPAGTYWVVKNNSPVNYTLTSVNGVFNAGSNTYYLQAGIGTSIAYSGIQANGSPAYYTF